MIRTALAYFNREGFQYTLSPPPLGINEVDDFLFGTRKGFCEHFASSFVFLMRAAGIPARVVTGYQGGEYNDLGNYYIVRQSDAHAWAEVWLRGRGWVRVDPTAAIAPARVELGMAAALPQSDSAALPLIDAHAIAMADQLPLQSGRANQPVEPVGAGLQSGTTIRFAYPHGDGRNHLAENGIHHVGRHGAVGRIIHPAHAAPTERKEYR